MPSLFQKNHTHQARPPTIVQALRILVIACYRKRFSVSIIIMLTAVIYWSWRKKNKKPPRKRLTETPFNAYAVTQKDGLASQANTFFQHWIYHQFGDFVARHNLTTKRLFISYSWPSPLYPDFEGQEEEKLVVWKMAKDLQYAGVRVWLDQQRSRQGDQLSSNQFVESDHDRNIIKNALGMCDAIMLVGTEAFIQKCVKSEGISRKHIVWHEGEYIYLLKDNKDFFPTFLSKYQGVEAMHCMPNRLLSGRRTELSLTSADDYFERFLKLIKDIYHVPSPNAEFESLLESFSTELKEFCEKSDAERIRSVKIYHTKLTAAWESVEKRSAQEDWDTPSVDIFRYECIPLYKNHLFVPRTFSLDNDSRPDQRIGFETLIANKDFMAVTGLAGSGKSQLVKNYYSDRLRNKDFKGFVWLRAETHGILVEQCLSFLKKFKISATNDTCATQFREFFIGKTEFLFVFDNTDHMSFDELKLFFPADSHSHKILITSTHNRWPKPNKINVGPMKAECISLFERICDYKETPKMMMVLGEQLGFLPLAMAQAFGHIQTRRPFYDIQRYLEQYKKISRKLLSSEKMPPGLKQDHRPTWITFELILNDLSDSGREILHYISLLAPTGTPVSLLEKIFHRQNDGGGSPRTTQDARLDDVAEELNGYSLLSGKGSFVTVHPIVSHVVVDKFSEMNISRITAIRHALIETINVEQGFCSNETTNSLFTQCRHILSFHSHKLIDPLDQFHLLDATGYLAYQLMFHTESREYLNHAEKIMEQHLMHFPADVQLKHYRRYASLESALNNTNAFEQCTLKMRNTLSRNTRTLNQAVCRIEKSYLVLLKTRMMMRKKEFKPAQKLLLQLSDNLATAKSLQNHYLQYKVHDFLGCSYNEESDSAASIFHYKKALLILEANDMKSSLEYAVTLSNMSMALMSTRKCQQAHEVLTESLNITVLLFGRQHPSLINLYWNLGEAHAGLGDHRQALFYLGKAKMIGRLLPHMMPPSHEQALNEVYQRVEYAAHTPRTPRTPNMTLAKI